MRTCNQCGSEMPDDAAFCSSCGASMNEQEDQKPHLIRDFISRHRKHIIIAFIIAASLTLLMYKDYFFQKEYYTGNVLQVPKTIDVTLEYHDGAEKHFTLPMRYADFK